MSTTTTHRAPTQIDALPTGTWLIDPVHSHVGFAVRHMMVSKVRGRFDRFSGEIITGRDLTDASVTVSIELASVNTGNHRRDDHLRSSDFFDVEKHPVMSYSSRELRWDAGELTLEGDLTLKGITRAVPLLVELNGHATDPTCSTLVGFSASGELYRSDFGVSFELPIPGGGAGIGDKVTIQIEIEAALQDGPTSS